MATKMKPHYYKITVFYCPQCGKEQRYRERVYGEKPDRWLSDGRLNPEVYYWVEHWDYCDSGIY